MVQEEACLDSNKLLVQFLVAQMRNQILQKTQDLENQRSKNSKEIQVKIVIKNA